MSDIPGSWYVISAYQPFTVGVYPPANRSRKGVRATGGTMWQQADVTLPKKLLRIYSTEYIFRWPTFAVHFYKNKSEKTLCWVHEPTFYMSMFLRCKCENVFLFFVLLKQRKYWTTTLLYLFLRCLSSTTPGAPITISVVARWSGRNGSWLPPTVLAGNRCKSTSSGWDHFKMKRCTNPG